MIDNISKRLALISHRTYWQVKPVVRISVAVLMLLAMLMSSIGAFANHGPAGSHLVAVGPISGDTGFPVWYKDATGMRLELCLESETVSPFCGFVPGDIPNPNAPLTVPDNFPEEAFWMLGGAGLTTSTNERATLTLALEAAFGAGQVAAGDQVTFGRVRVVAGGLLPGETYRVTHPYGTNTFTNVAGGPRGVFYTEDIGIGAPGDFSGALNSRIGPFLSWTDFPNSPDLPNLPSGTDAFIGDPGINHAIKGSPFDTNYFRIEGPAGSFTGSADFCANPLLGDSPTATDDCVETSLFSLMGKLATNAGVTATRATYTLSSGTGGSVDVWASSEADQSIQLVKSTSFATTPFEGDGRGRYFERVDFTGAIPPASVVVRNASDSPVTDKTIAVVDKVTITKAEYNADTDTLTIEAGSSDTFLNPALTSDFGALTAGSLVVPNVVIAPDLISVTSAAGGSDSAQVAVIGAGFAPAPIMAGITVPEGGAVANGGRAIPDPDGLVTVFAIQPYVAGSSVVYLDGVLQVPGTQYTEVDAFAGTIQFTTAPALGSVITTPSTTLTFEVLQGGLITLDGSSSSGDIDTYLWEQTGGPLVTLSNANLSIASFTSPSQVTSLSFRLTVTRLAPFASNSKDVIINVLDVHPPVANAGPDQINVVPGSTVMLDGSGSTDATTFSWFQIAGPAVTLSDPNVAKPTFVQPITTNTLTFELHVTGPGGPESTDTVNIIPTQDQLTFTRAQYTRSKSEWRIEGTSTIRGVPSGPGNTITVTLNKTLAGVTTSVVLGTAPVDNVGAWILRFNTTDPNKQPTAPGATYTLTITSSRGGLFANQPITIR